MKPIGKMILMMAAALFFTACAGHNSACLKSRMDRHEVRSSLFWQDYPRGHLEDRLFAAPEPLLDYLYLDNRQNGYDTRPEAAVVDRAFERDVRQALTELPGPIREMVKEKLIGVFLVRHLGTTGYTEAVVDQQGRPAAGFIVLDIGFLRQNANAWAASRENSVFQDDGGSRLQVTLEEEQNDNFKNAIQFIVLHEFGHLISIGERFHPDWTDQKKAAETGGEYLFYPLSWRKAKDGSTVSGFEDVFPERRDVRFYGDARLKSSQMAGIYRRLAMTNFVSLYGATGPFEDFAESFALYVHSVWMKKPYRVEITQGGKRVYVYESCWDQPRCAVKKAVLEEWFSRARRP